MPPLITTLHLAHLPPSLGIYVALCRNLQNAAFLRQQLLDGNSEFEYAFVDASTVISPTHLLAAVFRAVNDQRNGRMKSRNVHSEVVVALSSNNNIATSFRTFGISDKTADLLIVKLSTSPDITAETIANHLESAVEGTWTEFNDASLVEISDIPKITKIYKLQDSTNGKRKGEVGEVDRSQVEVTVLGLMALRGAS